MLARKTTLNFAAIARLAKRQYRLRSRSAPLLYVDHGTGCSVAKYVLAPLSSPRDGIRRVACSLKLSLQSRLGWPPRSDVPVPKSLGAFLLIHSVKLVTVQGESSAEIVHLKHRHLLQPHKGDYAEYDRQREYDH